MHYYNPLDKFCKSLTGAIAENTDITFRVKADSNTCFLVFSKDGCDDKNYLEMKKNGDAFELTAKFECGLFWYFFDLGYSNFIGLGAGLKGEYTKNPNSFQLSVYRKGFDTPSWFKGGIIYQIFPDRFCRGEMEKTIEKGKILRDDWYGTPVYKPNEDGKIINNDFFGGDFKGITQKLDYLKDLSISVIYLNPIFKSFSNHRYDTGDYMSFDPLLGTDNDFQTLLLEAEKRGIKIVLDGVFNHTGDDSVYFNRYGKYDSIGAYQSTSSKYYDWYNFIDYPNDYSSWWGIMTLPAVNKYNPEYIDYITGKNGVLAKYTKMGIGGWRLDVVDELHGDFVKAIRRAVKTENPDAVVIGEVWEDASNKIAYGVRREYFLGEELDSVMNYPLKNAILNFVTCRDVNVLSNTVKEQVDHYPFSVLCSLMNLLSTHDTFRLFSAVSGINVYGKSKEAQANATIPENEYKNAVERLKTAVLLQFTLPGVPSVYYGDEVGMQGFTDPLNRRCYPWGKEDKDILEYYKKLGKIRSSFSAFESGEFTELYAKDGVFVYKRTDIQSEVLVAVNLSTKDVLLKFDGELYNLFTDELVSDFICLKPNSRGIFIKKM